jgi:DNA-directed RNA polymerase subunit E'/Rpb7
MKRKKLKKPKTKLENLHEKEESIHRKTQKLFNKDEKIHEKIKESSKTKGPKKKKRTKSKIGIVMEEFKQGKLHSGSKKGPIVTNPKQAIAIGISEAKKRNK